MVAMRRGSEGGEQHGKLSRSMNRMTRVFFNFPRRFPKENHQTHACRCEPSLVFTRVVSKVRLYMQYKQQ